jgi:DNA-binding CsgD family transcriptional regulator
MPSHLLDEHEGLALGTRRGCRVMAFPSSEAALAAAVALQRLANRANVRCPGMGISVGDVGEGHELAAAATLESLELASSAGEGQILATDLVLRLAALDSAVPWGRLDSPWRGSELSCWELAWSPVASVGGHEIAVPPACSSSAWMPYVERPVVTSVLDELWADASDGQQQLLILEGEAGSGKSRLLAEFGAQVHRRGGAVLWGSCSAEAELVCEPFAEGLHGLLAQFSEDDRRTLVGDHAGDLSLLLPRLALVDSGEDARVAPEPVTQRHWMFEAIAGVLERVGRESPILFVVDDLHWARSSTLALIEHLARMWRELPLLLVLTVRVDAGDLSDAASSFLARAGRLSQVRRESLDGLESDALRRLVMVLTGHGLDPPLDALVDRLHRLTDGNPFLFAELWQDHIRRHELIEADGRWEFTGREVELHAPDSVRVLVQEQVRGLEPPGPQLLAVGALGGSELDAQVLASACSIDAEQALGALDQAVEAGLLIDAGQGRYRFRHDLVAQAIVDSQSSSQRCHGHRSIALALERLGPDRLDRIAFHHTRAVPASPQATAAEWALRAADRAQRSSSYADAADTLRKALGVVTSPEPRADLLISLGTVSTLSGDADLSTSSLDEAAAIAQHLDDPERLVAAAVAAGDLIWRRQGRIDRWPDLIDTALLQAEGHDRARLLGARATVLALTGRERDALAVGDEAVRLARSIGDGSLSARVMHDALFAGWQDPAALDRRLDLAIEAAQLARQAGDDEARLRSLIKQGFGYTAIGNGRALARCVDEMSDLAATLRQPWLLAASASYQSLRALAEGSLDAAEEALGRFEFWSERLAEPADGLGVMTFSLRREQGRLAEFRPVAELIARLGQHDRSWQPGLAALYSDVGLHDEASDRLDAIATQGLASLPQDHMRLVALSYLADACAATGHPVAPLVYAELAPWSGRCIWAPGLVCYGAADRYLGKLAMASNRPDDAQVHLEAAVRLDTEAGWSTWAAHSRLALGEVLFVRPSTRAAGRAELETVLRSAEVIGLTTLAERARRMLTEKSPREGAGLVLTPRELEILALVAVGHTNRQIGERLHTSRHTVANQIHSILTKTGCANRIAAVAWATEQHLLEHD